MSYEHAMEQWKSETAATPPPPISRIDTLHRMGADPVVVSPLRAMAIRAMLSVAILGFVGMALIEQLLMQPYMRSGRSFAVAVPIATLLLAMAWLRRQDLAKQMMVRALGWSTLVIGTIISAFGLTEYCMVGPFIALGSGAALLLMGNRGLGVTSRSFQPIAYRNHLQLALVMATADAGTLLFGAAMQVGIFVQKGTIEYLYLGIPTLLCGLIMAIAVWGIYRLRTWALVLNILANLGIAYVALSGYLGLTIPVAAALAATATMQLILPVPILAVALGDPLRDRSPLGRLGGHALKLGLLAMMAFSVVAPTQGGIHWIFRSGWVERVQRTWVRGMDATPAVKAKRGLPRSGRER